MNPLPERHGWRARCSRRSPAHSEQTQLAPMLGHANHSFGIAILREHFPDARAVATTGVLRHMAQAGRAGHVTFLAGPVPRTVRALQIPGIAPQPSR